MPLCFSKYICHNMYAKNKEMCVCVCVCVRACVCACVCVCVCVYQGTEQISDVVLKTLDSSAGSLHRCFGMQNLTFQQAALSCSYTRSEYSRDLTSIHLAFRTFTIIRRRLRYALHREPVCFCVSTHERVCNLSRKG